MVSSFFDELSKLARRDIASLLGARAARVGLDPTKLPGIKQVGNIANSGNRGRAAEVASNVRNYIRSKA